MNSNDNNIIPESNHPVNPPSDSVQDEINAMFAQIERDQHERKNAGLTDADKKLVIDHALMSRFIDRANRIYLHLAELWSDRIPEEALKAALNNDVDKTVACMNDIVLRPKDLPALRLQLEQLIGAAQKTQDVISALEAREARRG